MRIDLDDGQHVLARSVVMATGARWRELDAEGIERFRGAGVYHAAMATDAERARNEDVIVVGGGNSAGQAAVHLASRARSVRIVVRGTSAQLDDVALPGRPNRAGAPDRGDDRDRGRRPCTARRRSSPSRCATAAPDTSRPIPATAVFVMIGATPCTEAAQGTLALDAAGYLLCGSGAAGCDGHLSWPLKDREPHLLETVRPGVFTAGDVRAGATNRVAGAVGDGALAVRFAHDVLAG